MTRHTLHTILQTPMHEREEKGLPIFEWEHSAMSFQGIPNNLAIQHIMQQEKSIIVKCIWKTEVYYFGVGLADCENITLKKLRKLFTNGDWSVYTWAD